MAAGKAAPAVPGCIQQMITFSSGSAWSLCVKTIPKFGLVFGNVQFRKSASSPFITVLFDARWSSIFVVYDPGSPRFHDLRDFNFSATTLGSGDCPSSIFNPRVLLDGNKICREYRDTEIEWKVDFGGTHRVRRGVEVVYTSVLNASNYDYIQEWAFREDGTITPRAGSTGPKFFGPNDTTGHEHGFTWRLDFDFNGAGGDSVIYTRHIQNGSTATNQALQVTHETGLDWVPTEFNTIKIVDSTLRNGRGHQTEYELIPNRSGTWRHVEAFTKHDFWVTRFHPADSLFAEDLPALISNNEPTVGQDLVEWYSQTVNHDPHNRDEKTQTTPTIWTGFTLQANSLFDGTPFF
jgi:primary-amine oxidase